MVEEYFHSRFHPSAFGFSSSPKLGEGNHLWWRSIFIPFHPRASGFTPKLIRNHSKVISESAKNSSVRFSA